jgi:hypothetical protein
MRLIGLAVVLTLSLALTLLATEAQQSGKVWRIGWLNTSPIPVPGQNPIWDSFLNRMRELGSARARSTSSSGRHRLYRIDG